MGSPPGQLSTLLKGSKGEVGRSGTNINYNWSGIYYINYIFLKYKNTINYV